MSDISKYTPMMQQYLKIKEDYADAIVFFRLGDFYEMFFDDAITASKVLEIALTKKEAGQTVPMCGVPHHAAKVYIQKLITKGFKIAIVEQTSEPGKGLVEREVVQLITPGMIIDDDILPKNEYNFIGSVSLSEYGYILSYADISTGDTFILNGLTKQALTDEVSNLKLKEIVLTNTSETYLLNFFKQENILVSIYPNQEVVRLIKNDDQIEAAELADGTRVTADYFVSNMEVIPAYDRLLNEKESFTKKLEDKFEPASSGLVLHLGVEGSYPQLAHHNFFFSGNPEKSFDQIFHKHELPDDPTIYLVNVNKTDETQTIPGHENIKILPHIPYIPDKPFTKEEYDALEERVLIKLERMGLTDLRKRTVVKDRWLPEDIEKNYYSHRGAIYGTVSNRKKNRGFKHSKESEKYENLYFVGGTVNPGGGMPMVTLSGQQVSDKIFKKEQMNKRGV